MKTFLDSKARLFFVCSLALAGYFGYTAIHGATQNHRLADSRIEAQRALAALEAKQQHILAVKQYVASDAYVEQEARRRLGWVRPGEVAFVVVSPPVRDDAQPTGEWWERLFPR
jgi:cell division protein DivIC